VDRRALRHGLADALAKADRTRRVLRGVGARRIAIWPDEASVSLWTLPPRDLAVLLHQMTEHGDGAAAYYADVTQAVDPTRWRAAGWTVAAPFPTSPPKGADVTSSTLLRGRCPIEHVRAGAGRGVQAPTLAAGVSQR
jgi:hypothetical protein